MIKTDLNTRTSYKEIYKKKVENPVPIKTFVDITNGFMKFFCDKLLEGDELTLPARLGTLAIKGTKKKLKFDENNKPILPPNWRKTKELRERSPEAKAQRKIVYCTNEETNGVVYKISWSKKAVLIENKTIYSLRMTRANKRAVHSKIVGGKEYIIKTL